MSDQHKIEIKETISPAEEKFETYRKKIGLFLGPAAGIIIYLIPMEGLSIQAHMLAAILAWTGLWWVTEPVPIPVTTLFSTVLCVLFSVAEAKKVFAPFADPLIFLFMGSFMMANAMSIHGLDKRFAIKILSIKSIGKSSGSILFSFGAITAFISMWISNTATTAMMFPIAVGIVSAYTAMLEKRANGKSTLTKFGTGLMLMTAYSASAGGIGTPVGTPPNLIGIAMLERLVQVKIPFFQWMLFAVPILIVMYICLFILMYFLHKPEITKLRGDDKLIINTEFINGKWSKGEKNAFVAFLVAVTLWIFPGIIAILFSTESQVYKSVSSVLPESIAALIGAFLLFVLPVNFKQREFTLSWQQAVKIDWGTLILFGGGIALGNLMFETKLADSIGRGLLDISGMNSQWGITLAAIYIAIIVSEATSNTASANMVIPVMISISIAAGINPIPPAIGATLGASWGFMLPVSTAPNSIVYSSGLVPIIKMIRAGFLFDIIGGLIIWLGIILLSPILGVH